MAKLEKLLSMKFNLLSEIEVFRKGTDEEFYVDPRTVRAMIGSNQPPKVKMIAENEKFFWYVCPFCQQIHIESKRCLNVDQKIIRANCKHRSSIFMDLIIDEVKCDIVGVVNGFEFEATLKSEWDFMRSFENFK